jgi:hypothetical protein
METVVLDKPKETPYEPKPTTLVDGGMKPPRKPPRTAVDTGEDDNDDDSFDDPWSQLGVEDPFSP